MGRFDYREAGPQLLLQSYLQRVVNGGGRIEREYGLGRGATDLLVLWPRESGQPSDLWERFVVECKVLRDTDRKSLAWTIERGVEQTLGYMAQCGAEEGHLVVFDRRTGKRRRGRRRGGWRRGAGRTGARWRSGSCNVPIRPGGVSHRWSCPVRPIPEMPAALKGAARIPDEVAVHRHRARDDRAVHRAVSHLHVAAHLHRPGGQALTPRDCPPPCLAPKLPPAHRHVLHIAEEVEAPSPSLAPDAGDSSAAEGGRPSPGRSSSSPTPCRRRPCRRSARHGPDRPYTPWPRARSGVALASVTASSSSPNVFQVSTGPKTSSSKISSPGAAPSSRVGW